jgi:putative oxidoreductase
MNVGLLVVRVVLGAYFAAHGTQKLFGWFGGYGLAGTGGWLESLGFRPGKPFALAAGLCECGGGVLVATGLLRPFGSALIIVAMVVAALSVHWKNGLFVTSNGIEVPVAWSLCAACLAFVGSGRYSLDALVHLSLGADAWTVWIVLAGGALVGVLVASTRRPPAVKAGPTAG